MFSVLFLDQSTDKIGYSIFTKAKLKDFGYLKLSKANPEKDYYAHTDRREYLIQKVTEIVGKYNIGMIVYEGVFYDNNADTHKKLSKVQGTLEDLSLQLNIPYEEFPVTEWRSYIQLNSKSNRRGDVKKAAHLYIEKLYPKTSELPRDVQEDVRESICMGLAWINKQNKFMELDKQKKHNISIEVN